MRSPASCTIAIGLLFVGLWANALRQETVHAAAKQAADEAMIQTDHAFVLAVERGDKSALANLLDGDFTWTDAQGTIRNKLQVLQDTPAPIITKLGNARVKQYSYGEIGDLQEDLGRAHVLRVWVKRPTGWKAIVYQEVLSLNKSPLFAPGAGKNCENPCHTIAYAAQNAIEQQVVAAYSKLETAAMAHNSSVFSTVVADEFAAASSNSDKIYDKRGRMEDFDHSKMAGVAPTPLTSARMFDFKDVVLMTSEHRPDRGKPLRVTRIWIKRDEKWMETVSYQTSVQRPN